MQDVHLTCALEQLYALVDALEEQFEAQREEVTILDWGCSYKRQCGYIVLKWDGEVDEAFIEQLTTDEEVDDFSVYTIPCLSDDQLGMLEHAES